VQQTPTFPASSEQSSRPSAPQAAQEPPPGAPRRINWSLGALLASFRYAFRGLRYFFTTQRNAQIHVLISLCVVALGVVLGLARWEWLALIIMIALVLAAEALNTAIEAAVDVATSQYHPMAGVAKDVAAGAVVLCAAGAVVVGCLVFLPHLWPLVLLLIEGQ
jgi:diacylglycerol kinase (ATP)